MGSLLGRPLNSALEELDKEAAERPIAGSA
jgi:hypothetical protein